MILRKESLAVISSVLLVAISLLNIVISVISGNEPVKQMVIVLIGIAVVFAVSFLKEKYVYKSAMFFYLGTVLLIMIHWIFIDDLTYESTRYLNIGRLSIYTAAALPLISFQIAKSITKYSCLSMKNLAIVLALVLLPLTVVLFQINFPPVITAMLVIAVSAVVLKRDGRINIPWRFFILILLLLCVFVAVLYAQDGYVANRINAIFTRGACDPYGGGWVRTVLDGIFTSTPIIGKTTYLIDGQTVVATLAKWSTYNVIIMLSEFGYAAFIGVLLVYAGFFVCLFKMVAKTTQSSFAKYTSLFLSLSLAVQAVYSLLGVFLLDRASLNLPFMSGHTVDIISCFSFGIILMLYVKRGELSAIQEIKVDNTQEKMSLAKKLISFIDPEAEDKNNEEI